MAPELAYYALVFLLAGASAPWSKVALVVFTVWLSGQIAWLLGLPMALTYLVIHLLALAFACAVARNPICALVAALFVPIIAVDIAEIWRMMSPYAAWWGRVYLGTAQLILLWPSVKFEALLRAYHRFREPRSAHDERVAA